jgi:hypothetical protein
MCAVLCLLLTGCGGAQYSSDFPFSPGQSWVMANEQGELTFFDTIAVQNVGCETGEEVDLRITKDSAETYWEPGLIHAELHWIMHHDSLGQWRAVASLIHWDNPDPAWDYGTDVSIDYIPKDPVAYLVYPLPPNPGQQLSETGYAQWYLDGDQQTSSCLIGAEMGPLFRWTSKLYVETVETPAYSGPAVVNEEFEGCSSSAQETPDSVACAHEKWYFAPGIGLVEINSIWQNTVIRRLAD